MSTVPIAASAETATGQTLSASISVTVQSAMLAGFDVSPLPGETVAQAYARVGKLVPGAVYVRAYDQPGKQFTQTPWGSGALAAMPAGATAHISTKDTPTAATANPELAGATAPWFWTIHHEPEGDLPVAQFKADQAAADAITAAHPNGHLCTRVEVYTGYEQIHQNKPGYSVAVMYSGALIIGYDMYRDSTISGNTSYPDPAVFFAPLVAVAKTLVAKDGKPPRIMVPEFGGTLVPGDTGARRAAWILACFAYLRSVGCVAVGWWFTGGEDLTNDPAGLAALRSAVAGR
jgi:hypothetical protein